MKGSFNVLVELRTCFSATWVSAKKGVSLCFATAIPLRGEGDNSSFFPGQYRGYP
jgi:hypothetical protein